VQIVINGTFWSQPNVGSGQYLHGLIRWLPQVAPQHQYVLLTPAGAGASLPLPAGVSAMALRTPFDGRSANLAKLFFEQVAVPQAAQRLARRADPSLLFVPYFAPPLRCAVPVITTVGDIIPMRLPEYRGGAKVQAYMALVKRAVRTSAHILTFSDFSRADVVSYLGLPAERISAVLLAADERYRPADPQAARDEVARRFGIAEPFIYYVGGLDARKNLGVLLRALALLRGRGAPAVLALAGRALGGDRRLFPDLDAQIAELGLGRDVRRITVGHEDGPLLYQACTAFAFPSRYEGFGLPPLEAMACGAPTVVSAASSLPEVVGGAALRVDPDDAVGWASALSRLLGDPTLRGELRELGLAQAARFSWRRVAEETIQVLTADRVTR
jgi:glycosyltransferase involved in cell wall biosynthesis